ncbi:MAG: hypothetical protein A3A96_01940 [Candidatus Zambryskibacteria bacterium RIFCSPLOWO2_01_FULL_39_39]|uniref:Uncharacterized protein n=1 Tax=Candidatus Zambryskibacteria bacterium RIFCSPLOWO2_01_FULL_39_39 TaxID=1802758 RepID=A0A1G2TW83_9BACT|nr:MAG: hypothetical protein UT00_C0005G0035 [Parcubacteria group bacterium GW2011_GWA1_38_7]OHA86612.1 MAG: hypothetical protein A2644_02055 [Candidatus Zambryskibacteria bacterium RIFCSPHIGHO2_01_FULL_39_63]OHA94219.1 MAG: hypothetical protein A3B88_03660 [Candidatus Zambryskibacteria bacterium RIFCSPHIGHO2_02_FULL_39_19]OHA98514.1 MAG: hypothetical protein A3F20_03835 [Candidatus Zambryskibacteria bacterium RIFCSPHIGHO2_12_FULL_39_21]OHB01433.1 MAG: hypothetical protein A3A96_01940 [Candidat
MENEQTRSQTEVFEDAKESVAHEISENMFDWDFSKMMEQLRRAIQVISPHNAVNSRNAVRKFTRHCLKIQGEGFQKVRGWLNGEPMRADDIRLVLRTLSQIANGTLKVEIEKPIEKIPEEIYRERQMSEPSTSGAARKLIDHTITLFNSLVGLIIETGVRPSDVYDGDRMQICDALTRTCKAFGIKAVFPEPDMTRSQPVTREDLRDLGFKTLKRRKSL